MGGVMEEPADIRIRKAFKALLSEHPYESVTLKAICTSAGVTRKTLNKYYPTKESIVVAQMRSDFITPTQILRELLPTQTMEQGAELLISRTYQAFSDNRDYYLAVIKGLGDMWLVKEYDALTYELSEWNMYSNIDLDPDELDFVRHYFSGLNAMAVRWWLNRGLSVPPETMAKYLTKWAYSWQADIEKN